jgi:hypothetical protein
MVVAWPCLVTDSIRVLSHFTGFRVNFFIIKIIVFCSSLLQHIDSDRFDQKIHIIRILVDANGFYRVNIMSNSTKNSAPYLNFLDQFTWSDHIKEKTKKARQSFVSFYCASTYNCTHIATFLFSIWFFYIDLFKIGFNSMFQWADVGFSWSKKKSCH